MRTQKETAVVKLQEDTSQILDLNNTIGTGHYAESDSPNGKVGIIIVLLPN